MRHIPYKNYFSSCDAYTVIIARIAHEFLDPRQLEFRVGMDILIPPAADLAFCDLNDLITEPDGFHLQCSIIGALHIRLLADPK